MNAPTTPVLGGSTAPFRTRDGVQLMQRDWPADNPHARLLLVHGLGEHCGRYARLAADLNAIGVSVRSFDHRGHGLSEGKRGVIRAEPDCLAHDVVEVYNAYAAEGADRPFLLGHSLGGLVVMRAVTAHGLVPRGLVASSPALAAHATAFERLLSRTLMKLAPDLTVANGLPADKLSHAANVEDEYMNDPLRHGRISARLAQFIFDTGPQVVANAARLQVPTLLQVAGSDLLVDPAGSRAFAASAPPQRLQFHDYSDLYHEIYNEAEPARSGVVRDLLDWLRRHF
ncbi:MAG TPA: lysophospholipase [Pseudoxanthomonas sp.]